MVILNAADIKKAVTYNEIIGAVEEALILQDSGEFIQPDRIHMEAGDGTLLLMPSSGKYKLGIKVISLFEGNVKKNLPVLRGLMLLFDGETGEPLAILDGAKLTAYRTGAVGATGVKYLSPKNVTSLGIVGTSVQGIQQALFSLSVRSFKRLNLMDLNTKQMSEAAKIIKIKYPDLIINKFVDSGQFLDQTQVIITATNSTKPVLPDDQEQLKGKCFIGIGSYKPEMREFPDALFKEIEEVFVDTAFGLQESGDLIDPVKKGFIKKEKTLNIGKIITGEIKRDFENNQTVFFKSVGMALFDLMTARVIYEKALEKGVGQKIVF